MIEFFLDVRVIVDIFLKAMNVLFQLKIAYYDSILQKNIIEIFNFLAYLMDENRVNELEEKAKREAEKRINQ